MRLQAALVFSSVVALAASAMAASVSRDDDLNKVSFEVNETATEATEANDEGSDAVVNETLLSTRLDFEPRSEFRLKDAIGTLAFRLHDIVSRGESGNMLVSPFSLHSILSVAYYGSPSDSVTHKELFAALGLDPRFDQDYLINYLFLLTRYEQLRNQLHTTVQLANKLYAHKTFRAKQAFLDKLDKYYHTLIEPTDFADTAASAQRINDFVKQKTMGLITDIVSPGDLNAADTRLVMVNAMYFKSSWFYRFDPANTTSGTFNVSSDVSIEYPHMMKQKSILGSAVLPELGGAQVLELPYKNVNFSMYILLPSVDSDIHSLERNISKLDLTSLEKSLQFDPTFVQLPRFNVAFETELVPSFRQLGVNALFDDADLGEISDEEELRVTSVLHKATVDVSEEGSEASAASAEIFNTRSVTVNKDVRFIVNRPFLFLIVDKKLRVPLFMGRVVDPSNTHKLVRPDSKAAGGERKACSEARQTGVEEDSITFPCVDVESDSDSSQDTLDRRAPIKPEDTIQK